MGKKGRHHHKPIASHFFYLYAFNKKKLLLITTLPNYSLRLLIVWSFILAAAIQCQLLLECGWQRIFRFGMIAFTE